MENSEHAEGKFTKAIENQTAKLPSDVYLIAALGAVALSLTLKFMNRKHDALFVGQWVAPFLLFGVYNKLVKQSGND
ncbi:MAG: hypothetical protein ABJA37_00100 [Ferruginibacter sp.]